MSGNNVTNSFDSMPRWMEIASTPKATPRKEHNRRISGGKEETTTALSVAALAQKFDKVSNTTVKQAVGVSEVPTPVSLPVSLQQSPRGKENLSDNEAEVYFTEIEKLTRQVTYLRAELSLAERKIANLIDSEGSSVHIMQLKAQLEEERIEAKMEMDELKQQLRRFKQSHEREIERVYWDTVGEYEKVFKKEYMKLSETFKKEQKQLKQEHNTRNFYKYMVGQIVSVTVFAVLWYFTASTATNSTTAYYSNYSSLRYPVSPLPPCPQNCSQTDLR
jgi:hypothetical protein